MDQLIVDSAAVAAITFVVTDDLPCVQQLLLGLFREAEFPDEQFSLTII